MGFNIKQTKVWGFLFGIKKEEQLSTPSNTPSGTTYDFSTLLSEQDATIIQDPIEESVTTQVIEVEIPNKEAVEIVPQNKVKKKRKSRKSKSHKKSQEYPWPQDDPEFIKNSIHRETWNLYTSHKDYDATQKYGYDNPLVIKMKNIEDPQDSQIFISPKQFCETLGIKPKRLYACLESKSKIINSKYKLEIIPFQVSGAKFTPSHISSKEGIMNFYIQPESETKHIEFDLQVTPKGTVFPSIDLKPLVFTGYTS